MANIMRCHCCSFSWSLFESRNSRSSGPGILFGRGFTPDALPGTTLPLTASSGWGLSAGWESNLGFPRGMRETPSQQHPRFVSLANEPKRWDHHWKETVLLTVREKLEKLCDIRVVIVIPLDQNTLTYRHRVVRPSFHRYGQRPEEHFIHFIKCQDLSDGAPPQIYLSALYIYIYEWWCLALHLLIIAFLQLSVFTDGISRPCVLSSHTQSSEVATHFSGTIQKRQASVSDLYIYINWASLQSGI